MSRSYTKICAKAKDQFKAKHYNEEANGVLQQFNGQLDQNNMPINSVGPTHLVDPTVKSNEFGVQTKSSYMPTQSYHESTWVIPNDTGTVAEAMPTPAGTYNVNWLTDPWSPFWNQFDYSVVTHGSRLRFNAKEGMIIGGVTINVETRLGKTRYITDPNFEVQSGGDLTCEIGIFVNGVLCGRSGQITVGAYTLDIPFSTPIGNEFTEVVVKWQRDQTASDETSTLPYNTILDHHFRFVVSGISTWARNQYR